MNGSIPIKENLATSVVMELFRNAEFSIDENLQYSSSGEREHSILSMRGVLSIFGK